MIPNKLDQKMSVIEPFLRNLKDNVRATLGVFADRHNFPLTGRIKRRGSVAEKIEMGRYARFSEIDDLVAFTIIIPTPVYENEVVEFCKSQFEVREIRDKSLIYKDPEIFRFDSTRIIAKVRRSSELFDETGPSIFDYLFEVQVRTAFEHAWSVATHDLVYKGDNVDWKRIRLAAQLKAVSESLDAAVAAFDHMAEGITESHWDRVSEQIEIAKFMNDRFESSLLPPTARPESITRVTQNVHSFIKSIRPKKDVRDVLNAMKEVLMADTPIPLSLSLCQFFIGALCERGIVGRTGEFVCHVTPGYWHCFPRRRG
jgi:ppGpp synthetase/RelA/SpoT-type nucleotidyltranferase